jgi:RNA polymerase sigma-70 factor, ECF subfamily
MPVLEQSSLGGSSAGRSSLGQSSPGKPSLGQSDVLRQFARGDLDAFEALFRRHQAEVYGWIVVIVRDPALAEDLTIETFWRIHRAHARFDPARSFEAWSRRIATNAALDHFKSASHSFTKHTRAWDNYEGNHADNYKDNSKDTPDPLKNFPQAPLPDPAITREIRTKTAQAFRHLPPTLQVAATLALIEEQPYKEIAETLGISTGAVKLRVFRALRLLRKELKRKGIEP